jgi:hypothetical protein
MNGLLRRLTRRDATADETPPDTPAASEPVDATATHLTVEGGPELSEEERVRLEEQRAREEELKRRRRDMPAGLDPAELEATQGEGGRRGAARRRIRYLRRVREILLRDLGGFAYEVHRTAGGREHGGHREILERKAGRLAAVDAELKQLEAHVGMPHRVETVVREPGIGGTCPTCGELHSSEAHWCAYCGTPLTERARTRHEQDVDRTIADREAAAAEQAREAERAREAAAAPAPAPDNGSWPAATTAGAAEEARSEEPRRGGDTPTSELPAGDDAVTTPAERRT